MIDAKDIRSAIGDYLEKNLSFDAFEDWIVTQTHNIHQWGSPEAKFLAYSVELNVAEHVLAYKPEKTMRADLQQIANTYICLVPGAIVSTGSMTMLKDFPMGWQIQSVGTPPSTASELPAHR